MTGEWCVERNLGGRGVIDIGGLGRSCLWGLVLCVYVYMCGVCVRVYYAVFILYL